jgi:hypothetical protein
MNIKFLDKVVGQIISETRINNDEVYTPFPPSNLPFLLSTFLFSPTSSIHPSFLLYSLSNHCKEVYSLNKEETEYIWDKYKEGVTTLINDKDTSHQEKG